MWPLLLFVLIFPISFLSLETLAERFSPHALNSSLTHRLTGLESLCSFTQATSSAARSQALPSSFFLQGVMRDQPAPPSSSLCWGELFLPFFFFCFVRTVSSAFQHWTKLSAALFSFSLSPSPMPFPHSLIFHAPSPFVWHPSHQI